MTPITHSVTITSMNTNTWKFKQGDAIEGGPMKQKALIIACVEDGFYKLFWLTPPNGVSLNISAQFKLYGKEMIETFYERVETV